MGGKSFALTASSVELYSPKEVALAAGVPEEAVLAALGGAAVGGYVTHADAVRVGQLVLKGNRIFHAVTAAGNRHPFTGLAVSGTVHAGLAAAFVLIAGLNLGPRAAGLGPAETPADLMRLVFVASPGPGGGGGGGGLRQKVAAPKALREGTRPISSPIPVRQEPKPIESAATPPEPKPPPPLKAEQLPVVVAPIITSPADGRNRPGVLEQTNAQADSHGSGSGGGAGTGTGTGVGAGDGSGIGPGTGGGTGGGPYRPGSGIQPPRLLREVKADYTEDARQRGIAGEVLLEIVVRRDGTVGDVRILQGLGDGLNERATQAVRQWRFAPAQRLGAPVDVIVEVAVEFTLR
jgi:TonB family protein